MGRSISLFSGYDQKENRTTNYCLLILKMLYDENPRLLADFLASVGGEELSNKVGVKFTQQERKVLSVPDGVIRQQSFTIYLETKHYNWFYDQQLESHLDGLYREPADAKVLLALCNFGSEDELHQFDAIESVCQRKAIHFKAMSFEAFYGALPLKGLPKNLEDLVAEFRSYLDQEGLLPSWRYKLDVVNCAGIPDDVLVHGVYICPAQGGAYSHQRCHFFGMYAGNKKVECVALIRAVVDVSDSSTGMLLWKNVAEANALLEQEAIAQVKAIRNEYPMRIFLLGEVYPTTFSKDTPGGLQGSKVYFDLTPFEPKDAEQVANLLNHKGWKELQR